MASLIIELQKEAMDGRAPVSALLRKALVVSRKLGLSSLQLWIENELNGYKSEVPRYRKITGQLRAFNPFRGYIPVLVQDRELEQSLSERDLFDPIPEVEELYERAKGKGLVSKFDTETAMKLFPDAPSGIVPELHIDSVQFKKVLDAVRNRILEWSLQLETDGIVGDNITFTEEEKQTAKGNVTNYGTIIQGDNIVDSQVQKNSSGASQVRVEQGIDGEGLAKLLKLVSDNLNALSLESENRKQIESELSTIRSQIESPRPSNSIVRQALMSVRSIAEGCVGSLIASGIIFEINKLLPL